MAEASAPAPGLVIDQETLDHLPAFHRAIAEVLIEKGRWQLADSENKDSRKVSVKTDLSDTARNCNELYAGEIY
ncbi:MAG: hypothetical protein WBH07_06695 [Candidatus Methanoculleus thermohydrogenotrophicum]